VHGKIHKPKTIVVIFLHLEVEVGGV